MRIVMLVVRDDAAATRVIREAVDSGGMWMDCRVPDGTYWPTYQAFADIVMRPMWEGFKNTIGPPAKPIDIIGEHCQD